MTVRRTALYEKHVKAGGRLVEFAGWELPVQYSGVTDEHIAVREACGLFDVSHMGELFVEGKDARVFLQYVCSNDIEKLKDGKAQYNFLLNTEGGVVDDIIVYQFNPEKYLLCVNAANAERDFEWLQSQCKHECKLSDCSSQFAQLAIQGPKAYAVLAEAAGGSADDYSRKSFKPFTFREQELRGHSCIVARTGYTGEDGFEVFCAQGSAPDLWDLFLRVGEAAGIKPAGLAARDTLRLEAAFPLHGHELREDLPADSSGLDWVIKFQKGEFIGSRSLQAQGESQHRLVGLEVKSAGIVREGAEIFSGTGESCGWVSSGTKTPTVGKAIALGFVEKQHISPGSLLQAEVRGRKLDVEVVPLPFYP